ncbi:hypothetical protein ED92_39490 [Amycolatopsis sp. MJM2582]|nr:hypothetical protein ED92_39490 [Amycolatopsis sp. MJM2582]
MNSARYFHLPIHLTATGPRPTTGLTVAVPGHVVLRGGWSALKHLERAALMPALRPDTAPAEQAGLL